MDDENESNIFKYIKHTVISRRYAKYSKNTSVKDAKEFLWQEAIIHRCYALTCKHNHYAQIQHTAQHNESG